MRYCTFPGCDRKHCALGYCSMHYKRLKAQGDPAIALIEFDGRTNDKKGYVLLRVGGKHRLEHRLVMEKALGRPLGPEEIVHHKDHNPGNNDPSNLQVMSRSEHSKLHGVFQSMTLPVNYSGTHLWCPQCKQAKLISEFWVGRKRPTGHQGLCKNCKNANRREYRYRTGQVKRPVTEN